MEIGVIGLGRMGNGIAGRLARAGHTVVGYDPARSGDSAADGDFELVASAETLAARLATPRVVWLMVPAQVVDDALAGLAPHLAADDVVVEGGNSWYRDSLRRAATLGDSGIHYIDVGTSGGTRGTTDGYSLMIGGPDAAVARLRPIFETLAPAPDRGWGHVGASGAGHFTKMVHNAIEYGMMQAYAEGFALLEAKHDLALDPAEVAHVWQHGSVIRSWLLDLLVEVLDDDAQLAGVAPWVEDSGEGRWAVAESIDLAVPAPVITLALQARFRSRVENSYADRMLAALRHAFGGHAIKPPEG